MTMPHPRSNISWRNEGLSVLTILSSTLIAVLVNKWKLKIEVTAKRFLVAWPPISIDCDAMLVKVAEEENIMLFGLLQQVHSEDIGMRHGVWSCLCTGIIECINYGRTVILSQLWIWSWCWNLKFVFILYFYKHKTKNMDRNVVRLPLLKPSIFLSIWWIEHGMMNSFETFLKRYD